MSRHSKWAQIKHQKGVADVKRGTLFTKLANTITVAARQLGGDPATNFKLRMAIDQARAANMPKDNIERAVKRGTIELGGTKIEEIIYEGFGPQGIALILEVLTDNKNRIISQIKHILSRYGGRVSTSGSVLWMFERRGVIRMTDPKNEAVELKIIDSGAEDIAKENDELIIYTTPEMLPQLKEILEKEKLMIEYADLEWVAKSQQIIQEPLLKKKLTQLFQALDDCEEINNYYTDAKLV